MDAFTADTARLLTIACGMRDLLEQLAGDDLAQHGTAFYRHRAAELLAAWQQQPPRLITGEPRPAPVIVITDELLVDDAASVVVDRPPPNPAPPNPAPPPKRSSIGRPPGMSAGTQREVTRLADYIREQSRPLRIKELAVATGHSPQRVRHLLMAGQFTRHRPAPGIVGELWGLPVTCPSASLESPPESR